MNILDVILYTLYELYTFTCIIISAASRGLAADVALNVLNEMSLRDYPPNMICYGGALTACARCGE